MAITETDQGVNTAHAPRTVRRYALAWLSLMWLSLSQFSTVSAEVTWPTSAQTVGEVSDLIRHLTAVAPIRGIDTERLRSSSDIQRFYRTRDFRPAWMETSGVRLEASDMLERLRLAEVEGIDSSGLHVSAIETRIRGASDVLELAQLDVLLTDAFLTYSRDVRRGRLDPRSVDPQWRMPVEDFDYVAALEEALLNARVVATLDDMSPPFEGYRRLRAALARYQAVERRGGWPVIPDGKSKLKLNVRDSRVRLLRTYLTINGALREENAADERRFDRQVDRAVRHFQIRHGLEPDGSAGPGTRAALNVSVNERLRQIRLNMERWRWIPRDVPERYLWVNLAGFELEVIEKGSAVNEMRVIVGRDERQTPTLATRVKSVIVNPYWYVPQTVLYQDILPALRKDAALLGRLRMKLFSDLNGNGTEVSAAKVDWNRYVDRPFPYTLRQEPGPQNALGRFKFVLEDSPAIYLHDTPDSGLFNVRTRALSSGCIRLEQPRALAEYLLQEQWDRKRIKEAVAAKKPQQVELTQPMPIYLVYFTSWVNELGELHFRDDIYGRDAPLMEALAKIQ